MMLHLKPVYRQASYFLFLGLALVPLLLFPLLSAFYHPAKELPKLNQGILDLTQHDLSNGIELPLDGTWEFFSERWIVSNPSIYEQTGFMVTVPLPWNLYPQFHLPPQGIGSYRVLLQNCPPSQSLVVFIPNINSRYRAYVNGTLVAARGDMDINCNSSPNTSSLFLKNPIISSAKPYPDGTAELVIELTSPHIGGLYQTPLLMEALSAHMRHDTRNMFASSIVSVIFIAIACFVCLLLLGDKLFASFALLLLDVLAFFRILFQSNYLELLKRFLPIEDYVINIVFQLIILLLPVVFLLCMRQMLQFNIENKKLTITVCYDLVLAPFILWTALAGKPHLTFLLYLAGCVPFLSVFIGLYDLTKRGVPYALEISATLMVVFASLVGTSMVGSGLLVMDISLFAPTCFMLAMLFQLWIFLRRSIEMQKQALETENLRLRLKQNKADLMMSQIKPHFLYNSLIAIHTLCTEAPETAAEATLKFANFLRTNMNLIGQQELVSFEKELTHIQNYADIELLRHQKRLTMHYQIEAVDFLVPPLSIQPIVENAIRHGACKNIKGGTVTLRTYETETHFIAEITDDGPGFDSSSVYAQTEEPHGLQNILFRLQHFGSQVTIQSDPDHGTQISVLVPKKGGTV